ncbi:hypothetical protein HDEF_1285 [Candidatus Hamiltonella defensa 5AT (Acyrthosiphon pisum)]|uniref:Uncharacterized protein n=1 Tax=Hamiltonella defensa subsp. Acyrthosiphon pisum (strain 5AT) TaxID=572265 RepID=C4K5U4_HAMD5|nr:hypothetical protein HDEF_1285 [Candidatus Hamiltonella defensa 5AT (Acyrthosiphon pisum)]
MIIYNNNYNKLKFNFFNKFIKNKIYLSQHKN